MSANNKNSTGKLWFTGRFCRILLLKALEGTTKQVRYLAFW